MTVLGRFKPLGIWLLFFAIYSLITLLIFHHRLDTIFTHYAMPDIDTDGGLWYTWYKIFSHQRGNLSEITTLIVNPFGFDLSFLPFSNLVYSIHAFLLEYVLGFSWNNLIFITNVSSLITYPLSSMGGALLCFYLTKNIKASFLAGMIFGFSYYHVHMGRGQMSLNHIELIPFYFLSLFYFVNKKNFTSMLISGLTFSILFNSDAYYGFFSGLLSLPILAFYPREKISSRIKLFISYYFSLLIIVVLTNFNFILPNLYLFDKALTITSGRTSIPRNELLSILFYFAPQPVSWLEKVNRLVSTLAYIVVPLIAFIPLLFFKKNRLYVTLLICFLLGVVLSTYISSLYWINQLYFEYFGVFRGVSRIILPSYLFLAILVAISLTYFEKSKVYEKFSKTLINAFFILLCTIVIATGLNVDGSWLRKTDFQKIVNLYTPIANNNSIKIIAPYPAVLCPQPYMSLGQIVHNKSLACGASPFSKASQEYKSKIQYIEKENTIDYLTHYGVDTILIYNKIQKDSASINERLRSDSRLIFVGRYTQPPDPGYRSIQDESRDISVYQIKEVVQNRKENPIIFMDDQSEVSFDKIEPEKYLIKIKNLRESKRLIFDSPFSLKWQIFEGNTTDKSDLMYLKEKPKLLSAHTTFNEYANSWTIDPKQIKSEFSKSSYQKNPDGTIDVTLTMFFTPKSYQYLGNLLFNLTFLISAIFLGIVFRKRIFGRFLWTTNKNK